MFFSQQSGSLFKAFQSSLDQDVIESKLLECSHPPSAEFPINHSDDSSLENFFMDDNDNDNDNDNEGVEVETAYQHQNDIVTIADNISALNTKQQL